MLATKNFIERFNVIIGILVLAATVFGVWYQTNEKKPELSVEVITNDELTELSSTPNLSAQFKFNGEDVNHLWKIVLRVKNTGDVNLIGRGEKSTLLENNVPLSFGKDFKIIDFEINYNDINLTISKHDEQLIQLKFDQWNSEESVLITLYLELTSNNQSQPLPESVTRSIINGKVLIIDSTTIKSEKNKEPFITYPEIIKTMAAVIMGLFLVSALIVAFVLAFVAPYEYYKLKKWKASNYVKYKDHIDSFLNPGKSEAVIKHTLGKFKSSPEHLPEFMWNNFQGERLESAAPITETTKGTIMLCIVMALVIASTFILFTGM